LGIQITLDAVFGENLFLSSFTQTNLPTISSGADATHQAANIIFEGNERMLPRVPLKTNIIQLPIRRFVDKGTRRIDQNVRIPLDGPDDEQI
jgi:hypothetical protein